MGKFINLLLWKFLNTRVHKGLVRICWYDPVSVMNLFPTTMVLSGIVVGHTKIIVPQCIQH